MNISQARCFESNRISFVFIGSDHLNSIDSFHNLKKQLYNFEKRPEYNDGIFGIMSKA